MGVSERHCGGGRRYLRGAAAASLLLLVLISVLPGQCTIISNQRPLLGALQDLGGPELVPGVPQEGVRQGALPFDTRVQGFQQTSSQLDYETVLQAGLQSARAALQDETQGVTVGASFFGPGADGRNGLQSDVAQGSLDMVSLRHFTFRKPQPEAKRISSCRGVLLLEASKFFVRSSNISVQQVQASLESFNRQQDFDTCRRTVIPECSADGGNVFSSPRSSFSADAGLAQDPSKPRVPRCNPNEPYRTPDGTCNNLFNPLWGSARTPFVRFLSPAYENGLDSMRGEGRPDSSRLPSARTVSIRLHDIGSGPPLVSPRPSLLLMQWGQFLDHDLVHTPESAILVGDDTEPIVCCNDGVTKTSPNDPTDACRPIDVSEDPLSTSLGRTCMRFVRSMVASRECLLGPREQMNQITSYIDGSNIYGSSAKKSLELRLRRDGLMDSSANPQPSERPFLPTTPCEHNEEKVCYKAGDERVNEQPALTSMHTLWLRVHDSIATQLAVLNPHWEDEMLYQESRRIVGALLQQISYNEFLPVVIGDGQVSRFNLRSSRSYSYNPSIDASVANAFGTASFRFGHSLVKDIFRGSRGRVVPLTSSFNEPEVITESNTGPSDLLGGEAVTEADPIDAFLVTSLSHLLFVSPGDSIGFDLMALNIQRGRDHGLPAYVTWRRACGLSVPNSFSELSSIMPARYAEVFANTYRRVEDIDLFPAGLAETPSSGALLGPSFSCLITQQFFNLKYGDRFWYQNTRQPKPFTPAQLQSISRVTLAGIMCSQLRISQIQPFALLATSKDNPALPCSKFNKLDLSPWKEGSQPTPTPHPTPNPTSGPHPTTHPTHPPRPTTPHPSPVECEGVGLWAYLPGMSWWCASNCLHKPSYCPPSHCRCRSRSASAAPINNNNIEERKRRI